MSSLALEWEDLRNGYRVRTEKYTLRVFTRRSQPLVYWTVHYRGLGACTSQAIYAHGSAEAWLDAQRAAEEAALCECAETNSRNCSIHGNPVDQLISVLRTVEKQPACVYFVGSDSTGKTELAKDVERRYGLPRIHEGARAVLAEESLSLALLRTSSDVADAFQRRVFERQLELEKRSRPFVADRGLFDNLAYAATHARCYAELVERPEVRPYAEQMAKDVVFLVRPQKELRAEDGVRVLPSWEAQIAVDAKIELLHKQFRVPVVEVSMASSAARADLIDWCLQSRGFKKCAR